MRHPFASVLLFVSSMAFAPGCPGTSDTDTGGGSDTPGPDTGGPVDTGVLTDTGRLDTGTMIDTGTTTDTGTPSDTPSDGGRAPDVPGTTCPVGLGAVCETPADCGSGFDCMVGRCTPQARELCGGFAGAMCTTSAFPSCLYFSSADFGPCLSEAEVTCICSDPARARGFACPET